MITTQETWSWITNSFARLWLAVLFVDEALHRSPYPRAATTLVSLFFWMRIAFSITPIFGYAFIFSRGVATFSVVPI